MKTEWAKMVLQRSNGRKVQFGKIEIMAEKNGQNPTQLTASVQISRKRMGWEIVKLGLRVMFTAGKRGESEDDIVQN